MRLRSFSRLGRLAGLVCLSMSCRTAPVPTEVQEAERLAATLDRAGAFSFVTGDAERFKASLAELRKNVRRQEARLGWFRKPESLSEQARTVLGLGRAILNVAETARRTRRDGIRGDSDRIRARMERLKGMTRFFNEDDDVRKALTQADIKLGETAILMDDGKSDAAAVRLNEAAGLADVAEEEIRRIVGRYFDPEVQKTWRKWADETIVRSRTGGIMIIIVSKLERRLTLYRNGAPIADYEIGLGKFGLSDKLYSGDQATPEGKYKVVRKFPLTPFAKALLIDYPNDSDLRAFADAKRKGLIPNGNDAGGAIEIHGGGKDKLTAGCVGLEDRDMDEVYKAAAVGTPVTIVGTLSVKGTILAELKPEGKKK